MSTQEEQIKQGLSILDAFDQTEDVILETANTVDLRATRWLFCAGNTLTRDRIRETGFRYGGMELCNRSLRRTAWGNGHYLPRLTFTPMEEWFDAMPEVFLSVEPGYSETSTISDGKGGFAPIPSGFEGYYKDALSRSAIYPGREIRMITSSANTGRICEVELKALAGVKYDSGQAQQVESIFFPKEFLDKALVSEIPLSVVRRRVNEVRNITADGSKKTGERATADLMFSIADDIDQSCDLFENWANKLIGINHSELRTRQKHEHTFAYQPMVTQTLLPQMEVARQDTSTAPQSALGSGELATILEEREAKSNERYAEMQAQVLQSQRETAEVNKRTAEMQLQFMEFLKKSSEVKEPPKGK